MATLAEPGLLVEIEATAVIACPDFTSPERSHQGTRSLRSSAGAPRRNTGQSVLRGDSDALGIVNRGLPAAAATFLPPKSD